MRKNNQTGRILIKCGADKKVNNFLWRTAQMCRYFLSNVYKKHTQARKYQADGLQYGRSMVEMLGVLAIIGVLSVGAIAGYQKAMFKYKINKTITQITTISQLIKNHYFNQKNYVGLRSHNLTLLKSILPPEMIDENSTLVDDDTNRTAYVISPLKSGVLIDDDTWDSGGYKAFTLNYFGLSSDECVAIATADWSSIGVLNILVRPSTYADTVSTALSCNSSNHGFIGNGSVTACPGGNIVPIPIPVTLAQSACNCKTTQSCDIIFSFN